ncbi:type I cysteine dioxygenase [Acanthamoeba polyphaga moumouvirus]|uniref:Type I cysteine dioxygenase n=1 Tax=Acanthamoeba polyphaga moumouvirus TaxID=1269028 RepID=L7RGE9_9VIRU|nr:type I cysteine dioxygenase [Acanthamoeba polyphaga moumouvirus]AGC02130.1 type I cysteine dioxygenase [Acanthamoeba polyphaga moumouvirus]
MKTLDELANKLEINFTKVKNIIDLIDILKEYNGNDWLSYVEFGYGYKKNLIKRTNNFEIYLISWDENKKSDIHDHPSGGCLMRVLSGELHEQEYINISEKIEPIKYNILSKNEIVYKTGNEKLHEIFSPQKSVSIHLYSPPNYKFQKYN